MHLQAVGRWIAKERRRRLHIPTFSSRSITLRRFVKCHMIFVYFLRFVVSFELTYFQYILVSFVQWLDMAGCRKGL